MTETGGWVQAMVYVGCASWRVPKALRGRFPGEGTLLARYAGQLPAAEINSSFYRSQRRKLYAKWASEVPTAFRFAVKMPRWLSHNQRLRGTDGLDAFLEEIGGLGERLGPVLMQLPPSLALEPEAVTTFLEALRARFTGAVVCEPRHASWFTGEGDALLARYQVSRVAADPAPASGGERPGGWDGRVYYRLHGQPRRFYSGYDDEALEGLAATLQRASGQAWCVFNNTAADEGHANALHLWRRLPGGRPAGTRG